MMTFVQAGKITLSQRNKKKMLMAGVKIFLSVVLFTMFLAFPQGNAYALPFSAAVNYDAGAGPFSVATGDFDNDGNYDLAVANSFHNTVSVLLGNGDGSFSAPSNYDTGNTPVSVAVGDFNGDSKLDLAVANNNGGTVSVLLGNGDGTFGAKVDYAVGQAPYSVAAGDFNGDSKLDLAVANNNGSTVSVLLGDGTGAFALKGNYDSGTNSRFLAVGDFDGDSKLDLAVANMNNDGTISILLGNGDGSFNAAVTYAAGSNPNCVIAVDLNNDSKTDLATTKGPDDSVSVLMGNGDGTFAAAADYDAGSWPVAVTAGDFNMDGQQDLAVANNGDNNVSVLPGNGDGTFGAAVNYGVGSEPCSVARADFNNDGYPDLAIANSDDDNVSILLNTMPDEVWVATTGNDGNPGTEALPFATIHKGRDSVAGGGTIHVAAGTYDETTWFSDNLTIIGAGPLTTFINHFPVESNEAVVGISNGGQPQTITVTISGVTIQNGDNHVLDGRFGGGVFVGDDCTVYLNNCSVVNNSADNGGGIYNGGTLYLNDCTIGDNDASGGGGIYNDGWLTMNRCTVSGNSAVYGGGGIYNTPGAVIGSGTMWLTNCTVSDNSLTGPDGLGAGIYTSYHMELYNVTLAYNTATGEDSMGGGIASMPGNATAFFENCIVAYNTAVTAGTNNAYYRFADDMFSRGNNIDSENSCLFNEPTDMRNTDPLLAPLRDNGGPTFTHAISQISPAFNGAAGGPDHDQRGFTRPMLDGFDIGAYELQRLVPPSITSVNPNSGTQGQTLDVTITGTNFTGATSVRFGALGSYVSVNGFTVDSDTRITASITIMSFASPGARNVSVTTPAGTGSLNDGFTVTRAGQQTQNVQTATGSGAATFTTNGGSINNLTASAATACGDLEGYSFPHGFFSFNITNLTPGSTVTITITLPSAIPADSQYWKCINGQWVNVTSLIGDNDGDNLLTLTLTDGGLADSDGAANGTIIDPGGPAIAVTPGVQSGANAGPQSSSPSIPAPSSQSPVGLPNIYVQSASLSADRVAPGDVLTVNAGVANRGTGKGSTTIRLYVNGVEDSSRGITLERGDSRQIIFTLSRSQPGAYSVRVDGAQAGNFIVEEIVDANLILFVSCALIFVSLVLGFIYISRRQRYNG